MTQMKVDFMDAFSRVVKAEVESVIEQEIKEAEQRIYSRLRKSADNLALDVLAEYNIQQNHEHLVITVKKLNT